MKRVNILVISNMYPSRENPSLGVFVERISRQMERSGLSVSVVSKGTGYSKLIEYVKFYFRSFFMVLFSSYDVVYVHFPSHSFPAVGLALILRRAMLITHVHGADVVPDRGGGMRSKVVRLFTGWSLRRSSAVIAPSKYFSELTQSIFPAAKGKVRISPSGGVDTEFFEYSKPSKRARRKLLFLGRLMRGKGVYLVIDAALELQRRRPELRYDLDFAGEGSELENMMELAKSLTSAVPTFIGRVDPSSVPSVMAKCDAFLFPSYRRGESLGLVALEAMAAGRPVIAARSGAMEEIVTDQENGWLFQPNDVQALAAAMEAALDTPDNKLLLMSVAARKLSEEYSSDRVGGNLVKIIHEFII